MGRCREETDVIFTELVEQIMTEPEWLASRDPEPMLDYLKDTASDRKLRLLACAIVRRARITLSGETMWELMPSYHWYQDITRVRLTGEECRDLTWEEHGEYGYLRMNCHEVIETAELRADGRTSRLRWEAARDYAYYAQWAAEVDTFGYDPEVYPGSELRYTMAGAVEDATRTGEDLIQSMIWTQREVALPGDEHSRKICDPSHGEHVCRLVRDIFDNPFRPRTIRRALLTPGVVEFGQSIYENQAFDLMPTLGDRLEAAGCKGGELLSHCRSQTDHARGCWLLDALLGKG